MRKVFYGLGTLAITAATVAASVSCSVLTRSREDNKVVASQAESYVNIDMTNLDVLSIAEFTKAVTQGSERVGRSYSNKFDFVFKTNAGEKNFEVDLSNIDFSNDELVTKTTKAQVVDFVLKDAELNAKISSLVKAYSPYTSIEEFANHTFLRQVDHMDVTNETKELIIKNEDIVSYGIPKAIKNPSPAVIRKLLPLKLFGLPYDQQIAMQQTNIVEQEYQTTFSLNVMKQIYDQIGYFDAVDPVEKEYVSWSSLHLPSTLSIVVKEEGKADRKATLNFTEINNHVTTNDLTGIFQTPLYQAGPVYKQIFEAAKNAQ